jgi:hypothetical protein
MKLSTKERAFMLWALEEALLSCEPEEEELLLSLIERLSSLSPFSPFSSSSQWRASQLSSLSSPSF